MTLDITVVTPAHPARLHNGLLQRALRSAFEQTYAPAAFSVAVDTERRGAGWTRQRALEGARTEWVAYLDSDDTWYPHHLETLAGLVEAHGADYAYSFFDGNTMPGWETTHRGRQMDPKDPHHTTMTVLVRRELSLAAGFVQPDGPMHQEWSGEDWQHQLACIAAGAKFIGTGEITWTYQVDHGGNTSGLPGQGDAA